MVPIHVARKVLELLVVCMYSCPTHMVLLVSNLMLMAWIYQVLLAVLQMQLVLM